MQLLEINTLRKPKGSIEISKFKVKGDWEEIQINFELPPEDTERKTVTYTCKERPRNELIKAFDGLMKNVRAIAGLNWELGFISLITFKEGDEGLLVGITAQNNVDYNVKVTIDPFYPTSDFLDKILNFIAEAEDYIDGVRQVQQMPLFAPLINDEEAKELAGF